MLKVFLKGSQCKKLLSFSHTSFLLVDWASNQVFTVNRQSFLFRLHWSACKCWFWSLTEINLELFRRQYNFISLKSRSHSFHFLQVQFNWSLLEMLNLVVFSDRSFHYFFVLPHIIVQAINGLSAQLKCVILQIYCSFTVL